MTRWPFREGLPTLVYSYSSLFLLISNPRLSVPVSSPMYVASCLALASKSQVDGECNFALTTFCRLNLAVKCNPQLLLFKTQLVVHMNCANPRRKLCIHFFLPTVPLPLPLTSFGEYTLYPSTLYYSAHPAELPSTIGQCYLFSVINTWNFIIILSIVYNWTIEEP